MSAAVKVLVTIVNRKKGEAVAALYAEENAGTHFVLQGTGTARDEVLSLLGLEPEKDVVISLVPAVLTESLLGNLASKMHLKKAGHGIAFILPLKSITNKTLLQITGAEAELKGVSMETKYAHQLIVAVSSKGSSDEIMQAAREAGAQGGTILRGKGLDSSEAEKFLSITIGAEKEIVLILVPSEQKAAVMQSISAKGFADPEHHLLFSIPVEQVCGI